MSSKISS